MNNTCILIYIIVISYLKYLLVISKKSIYFWFLLCLPLNFGQNKIFHKVKTKIDLKTFLKRTPRTSKKVANFLWFFRSKERGYKRIITNKTWKKFVFSLMKIFFGGKVNKAHRWLNLILTFYPEKVVCQVREPKISQFD